MCRKELKTIKSSVVSGEGVEGKISLSIPHDTFNSIIAKGSELLNGVTYVGMDGIPIILLSQLANSIVSSASYSIEESFVLSLESFIGDEYIPNPAYLDAEIGEQDVIITVQDLFIKCCDITERYCFAKFVYENTDCDDSVKKLYKKLKTTRYSYEYVYGDLDLSEEVADLSEGYIDERGEEKMENKLNIVSDPINVSVLSVNDGYGIDDVLIFSIGKDIFGEIHSKVLGVSNEIIRGVPLNYSSVDEFAEDAIRDVEITSMQIIEKLIGEDLYNTLGKYFSVIYVSPDKVEIKFDLVNSGIEEDKQELYLLRVCDLAIACEFMETEMEVFQLANKLRGIDNLIDVQELGNEVQELHDMVQETVNEREEGNIMENMMGNLSQTFEEAFALAIKNIGMEINIDGIEIDGEEETVRDNRTTKMKAKISIGNISIKMTMDK